jgi:hypothetical protein
MACTSCSTSDGGSPKGCKNNGTCGTDSCNKLTVFDWLSNMSLPGQAPYCVEVRFKTEEKSSIEKLKVNAGGYSYPGHDGIVTLTGENQMKKKSKS